MTSPVPRLLALLGVLLLAACGAGPQRYGNLTMGPSSRHPGISCAPFARELSGIALYGDADAWWQDAAGRYTRSPRPILGSVLVFSRQDRLPSGHAAVVSRLLGDRQIQVTQANWVPGQLDEDQLVVDVSQRNDWTSVRVWYPPVAQLGAHSYTAYGFIHPGHPASRAELARATPGAARYALGTRGRPAPRARSE
jgi:surface antigen